MLTYDYYSITIDISTTTKDKKMNNRTLLMHVNTGSIDTYENWECEALSNGWNFFACLADGSLTEVEQLKNV